MTRAVSLDHLRTFHAVHRLGTLTGAARLLGVTQPTVTTQLQALEAATGQALFVRGARGVTPTAAGDDLARRLDGPLDTLVGIAAGLPPEPSLRGSTLYLGGPAEMTTVRVVPTLRGIIADGLAVRTRLGLADELIDDLTAGRLDLIISTVRPRRRGLAVEPLCDEEFVLVAAPALVADLDPARLASQPALALGALPLLAYAEHLPILRRWWRHVLGTPPPGRAALVVPDLRGLRAAAVAGAGATVLPRYLCDDDIAAGLLVEPHPTDDPPINTLYLAARAAARGAPHVDQAWSILLRAARTW